MNYYFFMLKAPKENLRLLRMFFFAVAFLLLPFSTFAGGFEHHSGKSVAHPTENHQTHSAVDAASGHRSAPTESPLHCHQKSPTPQAAAWAPEPTTPDQPQTILVGATHFAHARLSLNRNATRTTVAGPPPFILFGNFRS